MVLLVWIWVAVSKGWMCFRSGIEEQTRLRGQNSQLSCGGNDLSPFPVRKPVTGCCATRSTMKAINKPFSKHDFCETRSINLFWPVFSVPHPHRAIVALVYNVLKAFMEMNSTLFDELTATYKSDRQRWAAPLSLLLLSYIEWWWLLIPAELSSCWSYQC